MLENIIETIIPGTVTSYFPLVVLLVSYLQKRCKNLNTR